MKTHTTIGYNMCMKDEKLRPYNAGAFYHHEALNGSGYPQGLMKKDIPYEAQIIRVADEYDAIVSKRQYKSHIGISDTLQILIDNTKNFETQTASCALNTIIKNSKIGKNNPIIVKALIKVIIDDTCYEIYCCQKYLDYLKDELKRFNEVTKYFIKAEKSTNEKTRNYYIEGVNSLLVGDETLESFPLIHKEYIKAYDYRKKVIEGLYNEMKKIKKLRF